MEKKTLFGWAEAMGYKVIDTAPLIKKTPGILDREFTQEESIELLKTEPLLKMEKLPDEYSLTEAQATNVESFFRSAEKSLFTKSWKLLSEDMKAIHDYINLMHKLNNEKKEKEGTGTGETS